MALTLQQNACGLDASNVYLLHVLGALPKGRATKNQSKDSFSCSPPRRSLVKGERFMRVEGKPELWCKKKSRTHVKRDAASHVGQIILRVLS